MTDWNKKERQIISFGVNIYTSTEVMFVVKEPRKGIRDQKAGDVTQRKSPISHRQFPIPSRTAPV